ncbi:CSC1-like protein HYP1 [Camellia lanceoleosa]|uniref:CSC1-like protein HYP1 n=1 Tax=Camellia lanceoleosa TaxID=1840588 RepID=A0ACC0GVJ5_9ERIC|nr:CSC1-like protein HYP1 [Camellia lanceoleosa]
MTDRRCSRQRQHSASANSESSYNGSADESSYSGSSDESLEESTRIIPDPPMSWYPPGSLPSTSSSTGSTHETTADKLNRRFVRLKSTNRTRERLRRDGFLGLFGHNVDLLDYHEKKLQDLEVNKPH